MVTFRTTGTQDRTSGTRDMVCEEGVTVDGETSGLLGRRTWCVRND